MRKLISRIIIMLLTITVISSFVVTKETKAQSMAPMEVLMLAKGLNASDQQKVKDYYKGKNVSIEYVTLADYKKYFDDSTSSESELISSVYIKNTSSGGVKVTIKTPENITEIRDFQYESAAITAGIDNAIIEVIAVRPVTGEAALAGVLKAAQAIGTEITDATGRTSVKELQDVNDVIKKNQSVNPRNIVDAVNETKKKIADEKSKNPNQDITVNFIKDSLVNSLNNNNINIDASSIDKLSATLKQFADGLNQDNIEKYKNQLTNIANQVKDRINNLSPEEKGIIQKILDFIAKIFMAIINWMKSLFA